MNDKPTKSVEYWTEDSDRERYYLDYYIQGKQTEQYAFRGIIIKKLEYEREFLVYLGKNFNNIVFACKTLRESFECAYFFVDLQCKAERLK